MRSCKSIKKTLAAVLSAAMLVSLSGCSSEGLDSLANMAESVAESVAESLAEESTEPQQTETASAADVATVSEASPSGAVASPANTAGLSGTSSDASAASSQKVGSADADSMKKTLDTLCAAPRFAGSDGEKKAIDFIKSQFDACGYTTSVQNVTAASYESYPTFQGGSNVIAVKAADKPNGDILIISAHHDTMAGVAGANDDGSGVAAVIELAKMLKNVPSDTEIRFVTFTGEEEGRVGSRFYAESLSEEEKRKVIGDIQLDMLGYYRDYNVKLSTVDGKHTLVGDLLKEEKNAGSWEYARDPLSDHFSFFNNGMPSVMVSQDRLGYENHTVQDLPRIVDTKKMVGEVQSIGNSVSAIMNVSTPSYLEESRRDTTLDASLETTDIGREDLIYFDSSKTMVEDMLGQTGTDGGIYTDSLTGEKYNRTRYHIRWFGMETPLDTDGLYRRNFLEQMVIYAFEAGYTQDEMINYLSLQYGDPHMTMDAAGQLQSYDWSDQIYGKYFTLTPAADGSRYDITVLGLLDFGTTAFKTVDISGDAKKAVAGIRDWRERKLAEEMLQIAPEKDQKFLHLNFYTDGLGRKTGMTSPAAQDSNTYVSWGIDVNDVFDKNGAYRHKDRSDTVMVHEFGHALFINSSQADMTRAGDLPKIFYNRETYTQTAYARRFYDQFVKGTETDNAVKGAGYSTEYYFAHPDEFVDHYAGENSIAEDMAESFMVFVLTDKPESFTTKAEQKIKFFYDDAEMTDVRKYIRSSLKLGD